ncbi:MAG TPA: YdeI/OmpD-associated family protein [Opitutales bacterium]|jgi:hypothetical protein|nr:YdeI/OmpD-associated family protein [Opitutales bacterium]
MPKAASKICFKAKLLQPAEAAKGAAWTFLVLPKEASAKLPTRGMTTIEGTINDAAFCANVAPDGQNSHWLKVDKKLGKAAGVEAGDTVTLEIAPSEKVLEPEVPTDWKKMLGASPKAKAAWADITPNARRDWMQWLSTAKQTETRVKRLAKAESMLSGGKRRICCFDRSGYYDKSMSAPKAAE